MARQARKKRVSAPEEPTAVSISFENVEDAPLFYVNYVEVSHSRHDFVAFCTQAPTKLSPEEREEVLRTKLLRQEPLVRLVLPPTIIPGLIRALQIQREKYEDSFGKINELPEEIKE